MAKHVPFILTAELYGTISLLEPLHLDALLIAERTRYDGADTFEAPLAELSIHPGGFYQASASLLVAGTPFRPTVSHQILTRGLDIRTDPRHFDVIGPRTGRNWVNESRSPYQSKMIRQPLVLDVAALAFLGVGDPDAILALICETRNIGRMNAKGYGEVRSWSIDTPDVEPGAFGLALEGRALRALPAQAAIDLGVQPSNARRLAHRIAPPYWSSLERVDAIVPRLEDMMVWRDAIDALAA